MLLKVWESLRGYDKWTETRATLESSTPESAGSPGSDGDPEAWDGRDLLVWTDQRGERQTAEFIVPDDCPLYQKVSGDTLLIRYNPNHTEQFYFRQLHCIRIRTTIKRILIAISLIGLIVMAFWVREQH